MMFLARIGHPRYAQAFVDYLKSLGIEATISISEQGAEIHILNPDAFHRAQQELLLFQENPNHERYFEASWLVQDEVDEKINQQFSRFYKGIPLSRIISQTGWVTKTVFVLCALVFFITNQGADVKARAPFMFFANNEMLLTSLEIWRWISPAFVHFGILHFLFNLSAWWIFAGLVERVHSSLRLFALFLICGVISNWVQFYWVGDRFGGLSGVVYGVLGYLWFYQRFSTQPPFRIPQGLVVFMLIALAFGFTGVMNTANQAHLSGLLCGCFLGYFFARSDDRQRGT